MGGWKGLGFVGVGVHSNDCGGSGSGRDRGSGSSSSGGEGEVDSADHGLLAIERHNKLLKKAK